MVTLPEPRLKKPDSIADRLSKLNIDKFLQEDPNEYELDQDDYVGSDDDVDNVDDVSSESDD
jgi:hypothetical protein